MGCKGGGSMVDCSHYKESPLGPKRKYYFLTDDGKIFLREFEDIWNEVKISVDKILKGE